MTKKGKKAWGFIDHEALARSQIHNSHFYQKWNKADRSNKSIFVRENCNIRLRSFYCFGLARKGLPGGFTTSEAAILNIWDRFSFLNFDDTLFCYLRDFAQ